MDLFSKKVEQYCLDVGGEVPIYLQELDIYTHQHHHSPNMLSGAYQGRLLSMISKMVKPKNIIEIGTYTGYSALCLAEGLSPGGMVHTIDVDERLKKTHDMFIKNSPWSGSITTYFGDAKQVIPELGIRPELVFIDGAKKDYSVLFDICLPLMPSGGVILADNVLWKGKVLEEDMDDRTRAIHQFNHKVSQSPEVEKILLTIRDGLFWIVKK
ncbi:MAG: O-methyltransferase [Saprospiraceae bacterium]|jgi:caffeoyl-CoA O-methyltransferase|nr:class I SAM-dependent methyltransferase [Saprospiraceae bacterium]MCO5277070.1 O-methyltransferase [Saprospiraceae bacterium]